MLFSVLSPIDNQQEIKAFLFLYTIILFTASLFFFTQKECEEKRTSSAKHVIEGGSYSSKYGMRITQFYVQGCFGNFWAILGYIWEEIVLLKGLVKLGEIRNFEDFEDLIQFYNQNWMRWSQLSGGVSKINFFHLSHL